MHDECARALVQYEGARAHIVTMKFRTKAEAEAFQNLPKGDAITAMQGIGRDRHARKVILNTITMAMVSDCLHHIYEAFRCIEKRKVVVGFNLLRKPLKDSLTYLSWMLADENEFYENFSSGDPAKLSQRVVGNRRMEIFEKAIRKTQLSYFLRAEVINEVLFDRASEESLEPMFQHAVHLVTVQNAELRTSPQNFNFIFKDMNDEDVYSGIYRWLPYIMLFLSHIILGLFDRMRPMDEGAKKAFFTRSANAFAIASGINAKECLMDLKRILEPQLKCTYCEEGLKLTEYNALRILVAESFRCTNCRRNVQFPFSWVF